jgi:hypothetical protein
MAQDTNRRDGFEISARAAVSDFVRTTRLLVRRPSYAGIYSEAGNRMRVKSTLTSAAPSVSLLPEERWLAEVDSCRGVKVSLPRRLFIIKEAALPGKNREELAGMLGYEIANLLPLSPEETAWDWRPVRVREDGYTLCRVIAIDKATLDSELGTLGMGSCDRVSVEPSTTSLANLYLAAYGEWPSEPLILASLSSEGLDAAVVGPEGIECDRGVASRGQGISAAECADEIAVLISMCGSAPATKRICLVGEVPDGYATELSAKAGLPVDVFPRPSFVPADMSPSAGLYAAVGAAIGPLLSHGAHVGLRTADRAEAERKWTRSYAVTASILMGVLALAFVWLALAARAHRDARFLARLDARAAEIRPAAGDIAAKRQRLSAIEKQLAGQGRVLNVLVALYKVTPPDVSITSADIDAKGVLTIKGQVQQLFRASEYAMLLDKDPTFGHSAQQGPRAYLRNDSGKTFIAFTIVRELGAGKE